MEGKNGIKLILRDMLLILSVCISTVEHFRLGLLPTCGNHEIVLIRPADNPLESPSTLDANGDENKQTNKQTPFGAINVRQIPSD